nr:MAG TPA: hypothetical protein [Caudoviricetes sp.]DAU61917.1 MAG TPA: hypothetical protein [Caudoviricetes sp.]
MFAPRWQKPYTLGAPLTPGAVQALDPCTKFAAIATGRCAPKSAVGCEALTRCH